MAIPQGGSGDRVSSPVASRGGFTLVEVTISAVLLALLTLGLTGTFIMNMKSAKTMSYHTQVIATANSFLERLRAMGYVDVETLYEAATPSTPTTARMYILDPSFTSVEAGTPPGYRELDLRINVKDGTEINNEWTKTTLVPDSGSTVRTTIHFWLSLTRNSTTSDPIRQVMEATLIYKWKPPGISDKWIYGNVRIAIPNAVAVPASDVIAAPSP